MKSLFVFILVLFSFPLWGKELKFKFYSEDIVINYDESLNLKYKLKLKDQKLKDFYETLEKLNYTGLLDELNKYRVQYGLNDWFYYKLLQEVSRNIYEDREENYQIAFCWFLLNKTGYNANLRYLNKKQLGLYVYSKDNVFINYYNFNRKKYINLSFDSSLKKTSDRVTNLKFFPNKNGKSFCFSIDSLPKFSNYVTTQRVLFFKAGGQEDTLTVNINKTVIDLMSEYPSVNTEEYFKINLSQECYQSLIPFFRNKIQGMSETEAVRYLLSFVRLAFKFENDRICYGKEKPMIAEEVLYYPYADCEDKSAIFFYLVKELLNLNAIVLEYPNHVNIAVLLDQVYGKPYVYKGKNYSVCEPNVLGDSERSGIGYSTAYEKYPNPKVIYEYESSVNKEKQD